MKKYIIDIEVPKVNNAGFKLRSDFNYFSSTLNYISVKVWVPTYSNFIVNLAFINLYSIVLFFKYLTVFRNGSNILVQYPLKFKYVNAFLWIRKFKSIHVGILINDLDSLRHKTHSDKEFKILKQLDYILSPNNKMTSYLKNNGISVPIVNIGMYDYRVRENQLKVNYTKLPDDKVEIIFAGNLKRNKSGFIYSLDRVVDSNLSFHLYGDNFQSSLVSSPKIIHKGTFAPDDIYSLNGDYGLVWDGPDVTTCSGNYGSYLQINNPHKTSLYLTAGLPIITWDQSAISEFILATNTGICVADLTELPQALKKVTADRYKLMKQNALNISKLLRKGHYLSEALTKTEALLLLKPTTFSRAGFQTN